MVKSWESGDGLELMHVRNLRPKLSKFKNFCEDYDHIPS